MQNAVDPNASWKARCCSKLVFPFSAPPPVADTKARADCVEANAEDEAGGGVCPIEELGVRDAIGKFGAGDVLEGLTLAVLVLEVDSLVRAFNG